MVAGTIALHAFGLGGFALAALIFPEPPHVLPDEGERVELRVSEPPPPPVVESTVPQAPSPIIAPPTKPKAVRQPPPPDPVDVPAEPTPAPTTPERRRVVGLSFESTVSSNGNGPSFATGNTRMGSTARRAEEPNSAPQLSPNRVATRLPTAAGGTFTKPSRVAPVEPAYPELLRARGIEANVVVFISISAEGAVESARVVKGSSYPEFNDAALVAARAQRFTPATRNGEAVPYTLKYTYRFRLDRT